MIRRVLQIHTRYRQAGGEDRAVEAERRLLEGAGIGVHQVVFDNAELREAVSPVQDLRLAASSVYSRRAAHRVRAAISTHDPDIVHVHNTFAAASASVYSASRGRPVVHTLHNYRLVCPVATTFRDGRPCVECVGRAIPWPGVMHACVGGSRARSAVSAAAVVAHRVIGAAGRGVSAYIALTAFQRSLMIRGGIPGKRIHLVPNFVDRDPGVGTSPRSGFVFVGRLSVEKGIEVLLAAAQRYPGVIRVVGDGPLRGLVERSAAAGDVEYMGQLGEEAVLSELRRSLAVVVPSMWFEGFPLTLVEAFACGTPGIVSRLGSLAEIVDATNGLLFAPGDPDALAQGLRWATANANALSAMGVAARSRYETQLNGPIHLAALLKTYEAAADARAYAGD